MINELKKITDLKGKTISDIQKFDRELWLKFSDNTFVLFVVNDITEGFGYTKYEVNINEYSKNYTNHALLKLNLITKKEYDDACMEMELENKKRIELYVQKQNEEIEKKELEEYNRLKSKFESKIS